MYVNASAETPRLVLVTFGPLDSNLASAPAFPVLAGNALAWLARPGRGRRRAVRACASFDEGVARVTGPDGAAVPLSRLPAGSVGMLRAPGFYVAEGRGSRATFAVNVGDPDVSNLAKTHAPARRRPRAAGGFAGQRPWWLYFAVAAFAGDPRRVVDLAAADHGLMGTITWTAPAALWLLLLVPRGLARASRVARPTSIRARRRLQAAIRSLLLAALVLALARPVMSTRSSRQSIVYAVDVSHSIGSPGDRRRGPPDRRDQRRAAAGPLPDRRLRRERQRRIDDTAALRAAREASIQAAEDPHAPRSARAPISKRALDAARGELAPDHVPRIVLFSDGRQTAGDVRAAMTRLAAERVPVSVEPLARAIAGRHLGRRRSTRRT